MVLRHDADCVSSPRGHNSILGVNLQLKRFVGKESADALVRTILPAPQNKSGHFQDINRLCFNRGDHQLLSCSMTQCSRHGTPVQAGCS